ncbi:MAG: hypothetical protein WC269_04900, partial [Candidatus Gracilibacteria bacterium]|jgi:hypothetical protein
MDSFIEISGVGRTRRDTENTRNHPLGHPHQFLRDTYSKIVQYAELISAKTGPVRDLPPATLELLAEARKYAETIFTAISASEQDVEVFSSLEKVFNLTGIFRDKIDEIIGTEGQDFLNNRIDPRLVWFLLDFNKRVLEIVGGNGDDGNNRHFSQQKQEVEYLHSQQLAVLLVPIIKKHLAELSKGQDGIYLTEIGAKTGDLIGRIDFELRRSRGQGGGRLKTNAYDIKPEPPLTPHFSRKYRQPNSATIPVKDANLLNLNGAINHPTDILLLSNILHKIKPTEHQEALREAWEQLSPGGILIVNTPFFNSSDETVHLKGFYQSCDSTEYPNALLSWEEWENTLKQSGFEIVEEQDLGFKASLLDGFRHRTLVARKPIFNTNPFDNDSNIKGAAGRIGGEARVLGGQA